MNIVLIIVFVLLAILLVGVASISPRKTALSSFELERRKRSGDDTAAEELRRSLLIGDVTSICRAAEALLLVLCVLAAVGAFGFLVGVVASVVLSLTYGRIAHFDWIIQLVDGYYRQAEPMLLNFVERHPTIGKILRSVDDNSDEELSVSSREELEHVVKDSMGILSPDEKRMFDSMLHFSDKTVEQTMTPRGVIDSVSHEEVIGPLMLDELHKTGHSRFPVIDGDIDHVVGVLHIRNLLTLDDKETHKVDAVMEKKVYFINQDEKLEHALAAFIKTRHHMFIVINDYRETAGILSLEDTMEALLGRKIHDEFDVVDDLRALAKKNPNKNNEGVAAKDI